MGGAEHRGAVAGPTTTGPATTAGLVRPGRGTAGPARHTGGVAAVVEADGDRRRDDRPARHRGTHPQPPVERPRRRPPTHIPVDRGLLQPTPATLHARI